MRFSIFSVVAASSLAAAAYDVPADEGTTTLTSTTTRVITLTACPDSVVDCPYRTTTSTEVVITTSTSEWIPTTTTTSTTPIYTPPVVNSTTSISTTSVYTPIYTPPVSKSTYYPAGNTTTNGPTAPVTSSKPVAVTTLITYEAPAGTTVVAGETTTAPATVPSTVTGAASGLVVKSGAVGAAVLAALVALY
ncbi:hypothetical protein G7Z17_g4868 [Cylindrodendrum hubeiense]|uniref:Uncharacterized protein n=1 Tax=Cylindrodendrum hubeiense TaxID=595255 RepID=A0A9P5LIF7_9HYPO|nr:hypothetical protein G7Z17_g4868 [Cylindrodendrum hubeiense]